MPALIGGAIAGIGSIASGIIGSNAANNAAQLQYQASQNALALQKQQFDWQKQQYGALQQNFQPFITAGQGATNTLSQLANGNTSSFFTSPDYQFAQSFGQQGLTNYENAQGMGLSGGALKDVASFNQGLATQQYGNYFNRLMQIAQLGSGAAGSAGGVGSNMSNSLSGAANSMANTTMAGGQAQASGVVGGANAWTGAIGNGVNNSLFAAALGNNPSAYKMNGFNGLFGGGSPSGFGTGS